MPPQLGRSSSNVFVARLDPGGPNVSPIRKLLIANRGEIACRVIKTCRILGISSVAIYVDEDAGSLHISQADEAVNIGSMAASENPYLNAKLIAQTAIRTGADAVHPGYGYLSENSGFADEVRKAGIVFVGPNQLALSTLGDKRAAKDFLKRKAPNVPLIPGFDGSSQDVTDLLAAAQDIGFPIMVKASAGGGGKGLRVAHDASQLKDALERAQSEALRSFGSSDCILEKYIEAGKHVEMQIVGDSHGNVACLWERDCSVQRRNQKIIEETPCMWLDQDLRLRMKEAAVSLARLIQYEGAGTVEFIVDVKKREFFFLEVNARLQVEHPITEEVTGFDLVALQLFVAGDGNLNDLEPLKEIRQTGHAIECRLCAEDPGRGFIPERGIISRWHPAANPGDVVRFETAVQSGSEVSIFFDSMIAKVIVWAPDRAQAINDMVRILKATNCTGVRTNQLFLQSCLLHSQFHDPAYTTSFIGDNLDQLLRNPHLEKDPLLTRSMSLLPILYVNGLTANSSSSSALRSPFAHTPSGFRNQGQDPTTMSARIVTFVDESLSQTVGGPVAVLESFNEPTRARNFWLSPVSSIGGEAQSSIKRFNALSNCIRSRGFKQWPSLEVIRESYQGLPDEINSTNNRGPSKITALQVLATVGGFGISGTLVDDSTGESAGSIKLDCHIPAIGTWTSIRCETLLAHFQRGADASSGSAVSDSTVKAPMPCKVILVSKKEGEKVSVGDVVLVVESMKLETNIIASADGVLEMKVKSGDFVNEGEVLCKIS